MKGRVPFFPLGRYNRRVSKRGHLYVIAAPSGAGKTSLLQARHAPPAGLGFSVSCTTRKPRQGEEDGRDYHFVDRDEFERLAPPTNSSSTRTSSATSTARAAASWKARSTRGAT